MDSGKDSSLLLLMEYQIHRKVTFFRVEEIRDWNLLHASYQSVFFLTKTEQRFQIL